MKITKSYVLELTPDEFAVLIIALDNMTFTNEDDRKALDDMLVAIQRIPKD